MTNITRRRGKQSYTRAVLPTVQLSHLLSHIPDPPHHLAIRGEWPDEKYPRIAIVGTRYVTAYGRKVTEKFTKELVEAGFVIVSGFMYGVDAVAHETAVDCGGKTIAVLGYGLEAPYYPVSHARLAQKLLANGSCLVSEFEPNVTAIPGNFPRRNRIVSGLSLGVLVTEAGTKSGSLITARLAVEQGREVFAVPGPIDSPYSEGTKELVNLGAKLVTTIRDIVDELHVQ